MTLELLTLDAASAPPAQASESFFFRPARARSSFGWTSRENSSRINFDAGEKAATTK